MFENVDGYIYFIQIQNGPIKVGKTKDPHRRLIKLQVACPWQLDLLYFFPGGLKSERATQHALYGEKVRGEWYWPTARIFREIESEKANDKKNNWSMESWDPAVDFKDQRLESTKST